MTLSLGPSVSTRTLQADEVKAGSLSVNGVDIDALIAQRIYALFGIQNLPSSTDFAVTRSAAGLYEIVFADSWNSQFDDLGYSITLSSKSLKKGDPVDVPGHDLVLNWYEKTNEGFSISAVEQEDGVNGNTDTNVDVSVIDFQATRGMVVFCSGSFNAFPGNVGPI